MCPIRNAFLLFPFVNKPVKEERCMNASKACLPLFAVAVVVLSVSAQMDGLSFFTDAKSLVRSRWSGFGTFTIDTSSVAYEGTKCIKYAYSLTENGWDGFGISCVPVDASGTSALRLAFKGPAEGSWFQITMINYEGRTKTTTGRLYGTNQWALADIPLSDFADGPDTMSPPRPFDFARLTQLRFDIGSSNASVTGTLFLDNIIFVGASNGSTRSITRRISAFKALSTMPGQMNVFNLSGKVISQSNRKFIHRSDNK
jgi:hypothetical protein